MTPSEWDIPEDFDRFWSEVVEEARHEPLDFRRSLSNDYDRPGFVVESLEFRGMYGATLFGWIAYPEGARRLPGFVWLAPYGRESKLPDDYGTRPGMVSLSFNFHGLGAFHQETYQPGRGYFAEGAESPESWVFRTMIQNAFLATRVLQAQIEADEDRIGAMGMSQGGGMAVWLGAICPIVKAVCADMPFLANIRQTLSRSVYRYPLKELTDFADSIPLGHERLLNTVSYFDTAYLASRCVKPTLVSLGEKDPSCRPDTVEAVYEALPGPKRLVRYPVGHDWYPAMIENNRAWLLEHLGDE